MLGLIYSFYWTNSCFTDWRLVHWRPTQSFTITHPNPPCSPIHILRPSLPAYWFLELIMTLTLRFRIQIRSSLRTSHHATTWHSSQHSRTHGAAWPVPLLCLSVCKAQVPATAGNCTDILLHCVTCENIKSLWGTKTFTVQKKKKNGLNENMPIVMLNLKWVFLGVISTR